jgi:hypothetical protein
MKKFVLFLFAITLTLSSFSQWYEYSETHFINRFEGTQVDKVDVFHWAYDGWSGKTFSQSSGVMTVTNAARRYGNFSIVFDSVNIDASSVPFLYFEAKADTIFKLQIMPKDEAGNQTDSQFDAEFTTEWQGFSFNISSDSLWNSTDNTNLAEIVFQRAGWETLTDKSFYIRYFEIGDTTYKTLTNTEEVNVIEQEAKCYPNPAQNILNIAGIQAEEAVISDLTGKVLMTASADEIAAGIDVSGLAGGMYIISLKAGEAVIEEIFIKE